MLLRKLLSVIGLGMLGMLSACGDAGDDDATASEDAIARGGDTFQIEVGHESILDSATAPIDVLPAGRPSLRNMFSFAQLSSVAYVDAGSREKALCNIGLHVRGRPACAGKGHLEADIKSFDTRGDDHAFYLRTTVKVGGKPRDVAVLSFRGTASGRNLLTDLRGVSWVDNWGAAAGLNVGNKPMPGRVHKGFDDAAARLWRGDSPDQSMGRYLADHHGHPGDPPLYLTGHSLGGAVATVVMGYLLFGECSALVGDETFAWESGQPDNIAWARQGTVCPRTSSLGIQGLYTYGSPRVGDLAFAEALPNMMAIRRIGHFRVVNANDGVARSAPRWSGYSHLRLNLHGIVDKGSPTRYAITEDEDADVVYGQRLPSGRSAIADCRQVEGAPQNPEACPTLSLAYLLPGNGPAEQRARTDILRLGAGATEALDDFASFFPSLGDHDVDKNYIGLLKRLLFPG